MPFYKIDERIKIVSLPDLSGRTGRIKQMNTFRRYIKQEKPDLIVSFLTPYNILTLCSTIGLKVNVIVAERTDPKRILSGGKPMLRFRDFIYRRACGIIVQTKYAQSCYAGKFSQKTKVIYNPVMMNEYQVGKALLVEKKKILVTVGRLEPVKNQQMMINAFAFFHQSHEDYKLVIFGEGPMRNQLETLILEKNLKDSVYLAGRNDNVWEEMTSADCFLLSSNYEGMSNAMIEALCLGLPVISTKVSGSTDLIKDGINGFLVEINDANTMSNRMVQVVDNKELQRRMGEEAIKTYDLLRSDIICQEWVDYLKSRSSC